MSAMAIYHQPPFVMGLIPSALCELLISEVDGGLTSPSPQGRVAPLSGPSREFSADPVNKRRATCECELHFSWEWYVFALVS